MRRTPRDPSARRALPPWWKIKREVFRVGWQVDDILLRWLGVSVVQAYYKRVIAPQVVATPGALPLGNRAALYVIFPVDGVTTSHQTALRYIAQCGYVPIVISNLPLSAGDAATLHDLAAVVIVRPNIGYDFGAYRDGILHLQPHLTGLDHLALLNNSTWFPANPTANWFAMAEGLNRDLVGAVHHYGLAPYRAWDFRVQRWSFSAQYPTFHYGSFALLMGRTLLQSPALLAFWQGYRPSSDRKRTIKSGEMGLSRMIIDAGFTHAAQLDNTHLDTHLQAMTLPQLQHIARHMITPLMPASDAQNSADPADLRHFILSCVARINPCYCLVDYDVNHRSANFIKKSAVTLDRPSADKTLRLLADLPTPEAATFLHEAKAAYHKAHPGSDPI